MKGRYYKVINNLYDIKLPDPLEYGYEFKSDFSRALWKLIDMWKGRIGECVDERNSFYLLRFHDTPGGKPDESWVPNCLLIEEPTPKYVAPPETEACDEFAEEMNNIIGFG